MRNAARLYSSVQNIDPTDTVFLVIGGFAEHLVKLASVLNPAFQLFQKQDSFRLPPFLDLSSLSNVSFEAFYLLFLLLVVALFDLLQRSIHQLQALR
jgi:hypothetical protein